MTAAKHFVTSWHSNPIAVTEFSTNIRPRCQSTSQCIECSSEVRHGTSGKVVKGAGDKVAAQAEAGLVEEDASSAGAS